MVHYEPPKRSLRRQVNQTLTIIHLPDELLLHMIEHLSTTDVLQLRLVCSNLTPAGNTTLQQRLKRLYVHPSDLSLLTAVKICAHPIFGQKIEEVVVLGSTEDSTPDRRKWVTDDICTPWPCHFPRPRGHLVTPQQTEGPHVNQIGGITFAERYQPLLCGIAGLASLTKLSYATSVHSAGFNQTRKATIKAFCRRKNTSASTSTSTSTPTHGNWTDLRVLRELIEKLNVRDLKINSPVSISTSQYNSGVFQPSKLQNLAHVTLTMLATTHEQNAAARWRYMCSDLLSNASQLESLQITIVGDVPHNGPLPVEVHLEGLFECKSTSLTHLSLVSRRGKKFTSARNQPPSLQQLPKRFSEFIARHATTLQSVVIENILLQEAGDISTIAENIREGVSVLRRNGCEVTWRINQYHHHEWCGRRSGRWKRCQPDVCGLYTNFEPNGLHLRREDFERLAGSWGVVAEPDNESWDFGTMVVKESDV